jgi:hypothetical protein
VRITQQEARQQADDRIRRLQAHMTEVMASLVEAGEVSPDIADAILHQVEGARPLPR